MSELAEDLAERLRRILAERPETEAGIRSLAQRAQELERTLVADLDASEAWLDQMSTRTDTSIAEVAALLRRVDEIRVGLDRVGALLENLDERARLLRARWLLNQAGSRPPG